MAVGRRRVLVLKLDRRRTRKRTSCPDLKRLKRPSCRQPFSRRHRQFLQPISWPVPAQHCDRHPPLVIPPLLSSCREPPWRTTGPLKHGIRVSVNCRRFQSLLARRRHCPRKPPQSFLAQFSTRYPLTTRALVILLSVFSFTPIQVDAGNPDAKRLYDDLLSNYNKLVRPVVNVTDPLTVKIKLKLSQLIDVNLKNQIMTTNLWVEQYWYDYKLTWNHSFYGGVDMLHVPSDHIWRPDIVLYNNADGNFEVTLATKATIHYDGLVEWKPPAIYKSSCEIDVEYFPFDEQTCVMKFGSWTYDGFQVDLRHIDEDKLKGSPIVEVGVDLSEFYMSVEWDILEVPAVRHEKYYTCCDEPYLDITFNITMRRKTLFYTVNLIIPCMGISFLTVLVFYLPSDSGEKVNLSISILVSLTVFFLLVTEIIPPTSVSLPLLGKYLIFAMVLVTLRSIALSISILLSLTVFYLLLAEIIPESSSKMPLLSSFVLFTIIHLCHSGCPQCPLPISPNPHDGSLGQEGLPADPSSAPHHETTALPPGKASTLLPLLLQTAPSRRLGKQIKPRQDLRMHLSTRTGLHSEEGGSRVKEDWKYVAMVLDRLFLWIFTLAVLVGTAGIILQAPALYDSRKPIDEYYSKIKAVTAKGPKVHSPQQG
ncbi:unnamed protein product [Cyprideis torosa]|uniref:Uncharacterized protein n=1 Tax=Cyprideis torosa TaxID=163714 RepID=A0A7R8ZKS4_9CRUS|nr:unnamed protein product [Cyprideis torosa]CAG0880824.1 unnamed protein product [Cyprideis torosa]